jgi:hypothetical protein
LPDGRTVSCSSILATVDGSGFFWFHRRRSDVPFNCFLPLAPSIAIGVTGVISDRAADINGYEGVEDTVVDLYGALRDSYLQRREFAVRM